MRRALVTAVLGPSLALPSSAAGEPRVLAEEAEPTPVAAYGGWVAWSRWDAASNRFRLVAARGDGAPVVLPVRSRSVAFDVDLGPGADGAPVAVYSRCRREVPGRDWNPAYYPPPYRLGRGCSIYQLDLETGRERQVLSRRGYSLVEPSIWRGTLAVVVQGRRKDDVHVAKVKRVHGRARFERVRAGSRPHIDFGGPTGLDLTRGALAIGWRSFADRRCPEHPDGFPSASTQILLVTSRRVRELDRGCDLRPRFAGGTIEVGWPSFSGARLWWNRLVSERGSFVVGRALNGSRRVTTYVDQYAINSAAVDAGRAVISDSHRQIVAIDIPRESR